jgi:hypothetical protein
MKTNYQIIYNGIIGLAVFSLWSVFFIFSQQTRTNQYYTEEQFEVVYYDQDILYLRQEILDTMVMIIATEVDELQNSFSRVQTGIQFEHEPIDQFCLAKNIYHEARGEDILGQYAVAQVTLNRVESSRYPNTICEVVMQPFQFSWANNRSIRWTHPSDPDWVRAKEIMYNVLYEGYRIEGLETALFYHAYWITPNWKLPEAKIVQIGTHIFYTEDYKP